MKKEAWKKDTARDALALGSLAFYLIIVARALIGPYWDYVIQLAAAALMLFAFSMLIKNSENHVARCIILAVFTVLFYQEAKFTIFAVIIFCLILLSAIYLKIDKKSLLKGIILGTTATILSYLISPYIVKYFNLLS